jgi:hypothetical protein
MPRQSVGYCMLLINHAMLCSSCIHLGEVYSVCANLPNLAPLLQLTQVRRKPYLLGLNIFYKTLVLIVCI